MSQIVDVRRALAWCWRGVITAGYAVSALVSLAGALYALYVTVVGLIVFRALFPLAALVPFTLNLGYMAVVLALTTGRLGRERVFSPYFALPVLLLLPVAIAGNWWFFGLLPGI
ncbi:MAG TPA: hypothetical protein VF952_10820 [Chloroflexia bacterium]|jgi:hypothetical protein